MPTPVQLARILVEAVNTNDESMFGSICATTYLGYDASREAIQNGRLELMEDMRRFGDAFPDGHIAVVHQIKDDDNATGVFWILSGTHTGAFLGIPATNRPVKVCGFSRLDFDGGRLQSGLHLWDMAGLLRSLRLLPDLPGHDSREGLMDGMLRVLSKPNCGNSPQPTS